MFLMYMYKILLCEENEINYTIKIEHRSSKWFVREKSREYRRRYFSISRSTRCQQDDLQVTLH